MFVCFSVNKKGETQRSRKTFKIERKISGWNCSQTLEKKNSNCTRLNPFISLTKNQFILEMSRRCLNDVDSFCYICGQFVITKYRSLVSEEIKTQYRDFFGICLGDKDKKWAPYSVCKLCINSLSTSSRSKENGNTFSVPMVWCKPVDHLSDCYFCAVNTQGISNKNRKSITYPNLKSAIRPVPFMKDEARPIPSKRLKLETSPLVDEEVDSDTSYIDE